MANMFLFDDDAVDTEVTITRLFFTTAELKLYQKINKPDFQFLNPPPQAKHLTKSLTPASKRTT